MKAKREYTRYLRLPQRPAKNSPWQVLEAGLVVDRNYEPTLRKELMATYGTGTRVVVREKIVRIGGALVVVHLVVARRKKVTTPTSAPEPVE